MLKRFLKGQHRTTLQEQTTHQLQRRKIWYLVKTVLM